MVEIVFVTVLVEVPVPTKSLSARKLPEAGPPVSISTLPPIGVEVGDGVGVGAGVLPFDNISMASIAAKSVTAFNVMTIVPVGLEVVVNVWETALNWAFAVPKTSKLDRTLVLFTLMLKTRLPAAAQ